MTNEHSRARQWLLQDRFRFFVFLEVAAAGFLVAFFLADAVLAEGWRNSLQYALIGGAGGAGSGLALSGWFGRPGTEGWIFAGLAAILSPSLAGILVGIFFGFFTLFFQGLPLLAIFGAVLPLLLFFHHQSIAAWFGCFLVIHLHVRFLRRRALVRKQIAPEIFE